MPERDPERLPTSTDPNGPCPRCGHLSNFSLRVTHPVTFTQRWPNPGNGIRPWTEQVAVVECMGTGCGQAAVVVERKVSPDGHAMQFEGLHWWPAPTAGRLTCGFGGSGAEGI
jgi:hypothetical protein